MNTNESINQITKLISALSNGRVEEVEAECESFATKEFDSEELKELQQEVIDLARKHLQAKDFILNLSRGNLDVEAPKGNRLIDPLKELQANLRHLVWQTDQIVRGDYNQRIDFLGNFSTSFNSLVVALNKKKLIEEALRESEFFFKESQRIACIGSYKTDFVAGLWESSEILDQIFGIDTTYYRSIQGWVNIIHPNDKEMMSRYLTEEVILKKQPFDKEYRIIRQCDGKIRWVHGLGKVDFNTEGNVISLIGTIQDVTKRKLADEALKEREVSLLELNATKDKFFSIIAHDLRSPFSSIISLSNFLMEQVQEKDYEGIEEFAGIIQNSSEQAMSLLTNLLEWSRSQTGRMEYNPVFLDLIALVKEVSALMNAYSLKKSITILQKFPRNAAVIADKAMISTVLRNLISNAIKFTNTDGEIIISVEQNQKEVIVSVADNGIGISPNMVNKLFRIDESYSTFGTQNEQGTGLGLILCKEFIEKHGGKIWVETELDIGSTFYFTIPKR
jgi:two-component system, sensor histidine kinase and response regulator